MKPLTTTQADSAKRITVSLPAETHRKLMRRVKNRQVSGFVAGLIEEELDKVAADPARAVEEFIALCAKTKPKLSVEKILEARDKGRRY